MSKLPLVFLVAVLAMLLSVNAHATWSAIAVDRSTGEIGIVGASCTFDVQGIASVVPGKGAIVVQAASNYFARMKGVSLMSEDAAPVDILAAMRDEQFEPEKQQYGVITLADGTAPLVYSGSMINDWHGSKLDKDIAVLGNILVGEAVISEAFAAFDENRDAPLAQRLMLALNAGEEAGGDKRCGTQYARSAFLSVYDPESGAIIKLSVHGVEAGGLPAVDLLEAQFERLFRPATNQPD